MNAPAKINQDIELRYLYLFPYKSSHHAKDYSAFKSPKGAPYFYGLDIEVKSQQIKKITIGGIAIEVHIQIIDDLVWLYDCHYTLPVQEKQKLILKNHDIQEEIKTYIHASLHLTKPMFEEYTVILINQHKIHPTKFVEQHKEILAGLMRTFYDKTLDSEEIQNILSSRVHYSEKDLAVIDWNGAVIITDDGDFSSEIDHLKIGNYQLIRYRMIDNQLEEKLNSLQSIIAQKKSNMFSREKKLLQDIIEQRLSIMLSLDKLDTSLLLIGDWYSSKLYKAIVDEFYLDTWRSIVQTKLENLKSLNETMSENFTLSWRRLIDQITFFGWFVMMLGYFVLFFIDASTR